MNYPIIYYVNKPKNFFFRLPYIILLKAERIFKEFIFGCSMCGQCILSYTGFTCPMRCPKNMRNGPCGGYDKNGKCEVDKTRDCVWILIYKRAKLFHQLDKIRIIQKPTNYSLFHSSSYINHFTGRDNMPPSSIPGFVLIRRIVQKILVKKPDNGS